MHVSEYGHGIKGMEGRTIQGMVSITFTTVDAGKLSVLLNEDDALTLEQWLQGARLARFIVNQRHHPVNVRPHSKAKPARRVSRKSARR